MTTMASQHFQNLCMQEQRKENISKAKHAKENKWFLPVDKHIHPRKKP